MNIPLAAEPIATVAGLPITNSLVNGLAAVLFFALLALALRKRKVVPTGIQNAFEALLEVILNFMDQVTHDRERSKKFLPVIGTLFLFILVSNWMGLLPGIGSIGLWQVHGGESVLVPLFRPATSDLNMTLALAILSVVVSHIFGAVAIGFFSYWNKFIQLGSLWKAVAAFGKKGIGEAIVGLFAALVEFVVGIIELASEVAKMMSLSLRLFGNVFAGEVLLTVIASLVAFAMPLPFMGLELIVGMVQALVFATLSLVYLTLATEAPHGSHEGDAHGQEAKAAEAHT